ncbi:pilus assembly protein TadG-related protein [Kribbella sp. NPDC056861]|uniref:Tad domain-containing protein n=1 Tax=Kribbella sp. NPDC056861 TaxID=3154857 RepID=UPI00341480A7
MARPDHGAADPAAHRPEARRTTPWRRLVAFVQVDAPGDHRGALSPAVAILAVMIFTLAGLVIDGGRQLGAKSRAVGYAQEAARVGAATIIFNSAEAKIDTLKAGTAVSDFCAQVTSNDKAVQKCGTTELTDEGLTVEVVIGNKTTFLGMIGIGNLNASGTGEAHAEQGVTKADDSPKIPPIVVGTRSPDGPGNIPTTNTAVPPTLDIPCPSNWTIGAPTPIWTLPLPLPGSCTPSITPKPSESPSSTPPTDSPSPTSTSTKTTPTPTKPPAGGAPRVAVPQNSQPPGAN